VYSPSPSAKPSSSPPVRIHSTTNASVLIEAHPAFSCPLCRTYADLDEDVEVETADAGEAEEPADADTPVRESLEDGEANEQPNGTGNAAEVDGIHRQRREDAEMSDEIAETDDSQCAERAGFGRFG
ncbi:hypothetical protein M378DRAFT_17322, partial [Amanita muscaria Koide BX008]